MLFRCQQAVEKRRAPGGRTQAISPFKRVLELSHTTPGTAAAYSRRGFLGRAALAAGTVLSRLVNPPQADAMNADDEQFIDAHVHVFPAETSRYPLRPGARRDQLPLPSFTPEALLAQAQPCGVRRFVLIQYSLFGVDNSYILNVREQQPKVFAVVGAIDAHDKPQDAIRALARRGVRGLRLTGTGADPDRWLHDESLSAVWRMAGDEGLAICLLTVPAFFPALDVLCRKFPHTRVVLDHCARIGADGQFNPTQLDSLCGLANHQQVRVKASAFYSLGKKEAPYLDLAPLIRRLLEAFGADRLMWGSDAPFQILGKHTYRDSVELLRTRLDFLTADDRRRLLRTTAESTFFD